jgi:hypothetical protein
MAFVHGGRSFAAEGHVAGDQDVAGQGQRDPAGIVPGSRRDFLNLSAGLLAAASLPDMASAATAPARGDGSRKFAPDGRVLPFAGSTVVCHLPQQGSNSGAFNVLLDFYRNARWTGFGSKLALLPPSSYHMTVIGCATDAIREPGKWPIDVPLDASIEECSRIVGERLQRARLQNISPISMKIDQSDSGYDGNTLRIPLEPVDRAELDRIEGLRRAMARAIGIPEPVPGAYQFHITLAYLIQAFEVVEEQAALRVLRDFKHRLAGSAPVLFLGQPEFCLFEDMFAFRRQFFIGLP